MLNPSKGAICIVKAVMIILGIKPDKVNVPGEMKKKEDWFNKGKAVLMKEPAKFLVKLKDYAENERENIPAKHIK